MRRTMLKSKVHRATVTGSDLHYEPRVVHVDSGNSIVRVDELVGGLVG
jgi:aspartate 1-decarboxylase